MHTCMCVIAAGPDVRGVALQVVGHGPQGLQDALQGPGLSEYQIIVWCIYVYKYIIDNTRPWRACRTPSRVQASRVSRVQME